MNTKLFRTKGQIEIGEALNFASNHNSKVIVVDHPGSGFKFAVKYFISLSSSVKIVYSDLQNDGNRHEIAVKMFQQLMHIKFSNLNYKHSRLSDLIRVLGNRVKQDLKGKRILFVFDNFHQLQSRPSLERFFKLLELINFKCGIVLRTNLNHFKRIKRIDEKLYSRIFELDRKLITKNSRDDIRMLCSVYGLKNYDIVDEIASKTLNFRIAMALINKYSHLKLDPFSNQLRLGFSS